MYIAGIDGALRSKNEISEQKKTNRKEKKKKKVPTWDVGCDGLVSAQQERASSELLRSWELGFAQRQDGGRPSPPFYTCVVFFEIQFSPFSIYAWYPCGRFRKVRLWLIGLVVVVRLRLQFQF
jgi:hypothetical protein